jgi:hypothetical protein
MITLRAMWTEKWEERERLFEGPQAGLTWYKDKALGWTTGRGKRRFSSPKCADQLWGPISFLFNGNIPS